MPTYTQAQRPLELITPLGPDVLLIEKLSGQEMISGLFRFELDLLAEPDQEIAFDKLLGQKMTVSLRQAPGQVRHFNGICSRLRQGPIVRFSDRAVFVRYQAELVPRFWLWTKEVQSRIFQDKKVLDILRMVFKQPDPTMIVMDGGVREREVYEPRNYCVQFQESSFAFASRLMEEEGIYYYFDHAADDHYLQLLDLALQHHRLPTPYDAVPLKEEGVPQENVVTSWGKMQDMAAPRYLVQDYHFELPHARLEALAQMRPGVNVGGVDHVLSVPGSDRLEVHNHNGSFAHRFDGIGPGGQQQPERLQQVFKENQRLAKLHMERAAVGSLRYEGTGTCAGFSPGHVFGLEGPARVRGQYLLTSIEHHARQAPYRSGGEETFHYDNRFQCVPASLPYRPSLTTPPQRIHGTMTATVAGGKEGEVCTDKYGRIKVRFHWDRRAEDDNSCWIRVVHGWAGKQWGAIHLPRVGQEVVVAFEEGDPDRPIALGSVYNAAYLPPLTLPENAAVSGIRSRTLAPEPHPDHPTPIDTHKEDKEVHSGVLISDHKDEEVVHLQSRKDLYIGAAEDMHMLVEEELTTSCSGEMFTSVGWGLPEAHWQDGALKWTPAAKTAVGGERWDVLYGTHVTAEGLLTNNYTIFSRNDIIIDPTSWLAAQIPSAKWGNRFLVGKVPSGRTEALYGSRNLTGFGTHCFTQHGPCLQRVAASKPWEKVWAIGHTAASLATCVLPLIYVGSGNKHLFKVATNLPLVGDHIPIFGNSVVGWVDHAAGLCLAIGNHLIRDWAMAEAEADIARVSALLSSKMVANLRIIRPFSTDIVEYARYGLELAKTSSTVENHLAEGGYGLQADRIQLLARKGGISLVSEEKPTVIYSEKDVAIASGTCAAIISGTNGQVELVTGGNPVTDSQVHMDASSLILNSGAQTKITMTNQSLTLKAGPSTLELGPLGITMSVGKTTVKLSATDATINAPLVYINNPALKISSLGGVRVGSHFFTENGLVNIKGSSVTVDAPLVNIKADGTVTVKGLAMNLG